LARIQTCGATAPIGGAALTVAALIVAATFAPRAHAATPLTASSAAAALNVAAVINGQKLSLLNQVPAAGSAPPDYNVTTSLATYSKSSTTASGITLTASARTIGDKATAVTAAAITAIASSSIGSISAILSSSSFGTLMTLTGSRVMSKASLKLTKAGVASSTGSTTIVRLAIDAPLLGINNVTFAGTPTINQVLFHNADDSLVVYLNAQTVTKAAGRQMSIKVDAVDVRIRNFSLAGNTVAGDIEIGSSFAK
jgi:hypothetical protein